MCPRYNLPMLLTDAHPGMERDLRFFPAETRNPKTLTRAQVDQFNRKGFVFPLDVFDEPEAGANRAWFDGLMQRAAAAGHNSYSINGWDKHCSAIYDLAVEPRILDYVEDLPRPGPRLHHDPFLLQGTGGDEAGRLAPGRFLLGDHPEQGS